MGYNIHCFDVINTSLKVMTILDRNNITDTRLKNIFLSSNQTKGLNYIIHIFLIILEVK